MINTKLLERQVLSIGNVNKAKPESGVYIFSNDGRALYIGASINVHNRLRQRKYEGFLLTGNNRKNIEDFRSEYLYTYKRAKEHHDIIVYYTVNHHYLEWQLYHQLAPIYNTEEPQLRHSKRKCPCHTCQNTSMINKN